jgi:predicted nucleic acid-binding protein
MIVVSDTSPINYLVLIGPVDVLPQLYGEVIVP